MTNRSDMDVIHDVWLLLKASGNRYVQLVLASIDVKFIEFGHSWQ